MVFTQPLLFLPFIFLDVFWRCLFLLSVGVGGAVGSWLVRSYPDLAVRVRALTGYIVLSSWASLYSHNSLHPLGV